MTLSRQDELSNVGVPAKRKRSSDALRFGSVKRRRMSDAFVERGVATEVDRTLPSWRCFTDLHLATGLRPEVLSRETRLLCRIPCKVFKGVDVVLARSNVRLRPRQMARRLRREAVTVASSSAPPSSIPRGNGLPAAPVFDEVSNATQHSDLRRYTIDTLHFVHSNADKVGKGNARSFHVQSVVFNNAMCVLQCVAGSMVSFAFVVYTGLRLAHTCERKKCRAGQLAQELEPLVDTWGHRPSEVPDPLNRKTSKAHAASSNSQEIPLGAPKGSTDCSSEEAYGEMTLMGSNPCTKPELAAFKALRSLCPPPNSRILILGMGGNSMAVALRGVLGPAAVIEVVEVEPAVVAACRQVGTLRDTDTNMKIHVQDADTLLPTLPHNAYDLIFMDIFEPMSATMRNLHPWVLAARKILKPGGLLVMNEHELPAAEGVAPYTEVFGEGNVQAVNVRGWNESVVVCVAPGDPVTDKFSLLVTKGHADLAFDIYESLMPGWLPHFSWLVEAKTYSHKRRQCRLWRS